MLLAVIFILSHTLLCGEQDSDFRVPCFRVTMVDFSSLPLATAELIIFNETKRNETKRNETKRNETKRNETKRKEK